MREYADLILSGITKTVEGLSTQYEVNDCYRMGLMETYELALAFKAEHPADEQELITKAWLRRVGAEREDHPAKCTFRRDDAMDVGLWLVDDGWKAMMIFAPNVESTITRGLKTRGDLRKLANALGITLKETP